MYGVHLSVSIHVLTILGHAASSENEQNVVVPQDEPLIEADANSWNVKIAALTTEDDTAARDNVSNVSNARAAAMLAEVLAKVLANCEQLSDHPSIPELIDHDSECDGDLRSQLGHWCAEIEGWQSLVETCRLRQAQWETVDGWTVPLSDLVRPYSPLSIDSDDDALMEFAYWTDV
ncbi:hypothetical protein DFH06DRAFT_1135930 [Mycena polygramma]|nr:hypothetical protein DFH06DRAFT_1135930 [Mycena polygramma]